ncbi:MAG: ABC-three component system middle component 2 [Pirellulales bacterium]
MGNTVTRDESRSPSPFNGPVESGLRAAVLLYAIHPEYASLQRLVIFDYLLIHSDDIPDGPPGLHPKTPYRSGELLVRRDTLRRGILLYMSRGLIGNHYRESGIAYSATERTGAFLDALASEYTCALRKRAEWVAERFDSYSDQDLDLLVKEHLGEWGAEFEMDSVLWSDAP